MIAENHGLVIEAQLVATGATAHDINKAIQKYYNALYLAQSFPKCRQYQHLLHTTEESLRVLVQEQREFHKTCEQAKAAAAN